MKTAEDAGGSRTRSPDRRNIRLYFGKDGYTI